MRITPSQSQPTDEHVWIRLINLGDEEALESMVKAYSSRLCRFASHLVKSDAVSEELVQEVFCRIWEQRASWAPKQSVKSYLYTAVKNQAIGYLRHSKFEALLESDEDLLDRNDLPDEALHASDFAKAVQETIDDLPDRCRLIYRLHREDGLTYNEIAEALGISPKTVETQMGRALKVLRSRLSPFLPFLFLFSRFHQTLS